MKPRKSNAAGFIISRLDHFLLASLLCTPQISARQNHSVAHPGDRIYLDVVVSSTSGPPVSSPQQKDSLFWITTCEKPSLFHGSASLFLFRRARRNALLMSAVRNRSGESVGSW